MKATLITSSEYKANTPSVFIYVDGNYYGDLTYVSLRKPENVSYWLTATCSDADRCFTVQEVEILEEQVARVAKLQSLCNALGGMIKSYPQWKSYPTFKVKRGKAYEAYKREYQEYQNAIQAISAYNKPYDTALSAAYSELMDIIRSL